MREYVLISPEGYKVGKLEYDNYLWQDILASSLGRPLRLTNPAQVNIRKEKSYQPLTETSISEENAMDEEYFSLAKSLSPVEIYRFLEENCQQVKENIMAYDLKEKNRLNYLSNKLSEIMNEILLKETKGKLEYSDDIMRLYAQGLKVVYIMNGQKITPKKLEV